MNLKEMLKRLQQKDLRRKRSRKEDDDFEDCSLRYKKIGTKK
jgi:hypothetical protein